MISKLFLGLRPSQLAYCFSQVLEKFSGREDYHRGAGVWIVMSCVEGNEIVTIVQYRGRQNRSVVGMCLGEEASDLLNGGIRHERECTLDWRLERRQCSG